MAMNKQNGLAYDLSLFEPETTKKPSYKEEPKKGGADSNVIRLERRAAEKSAKKKKRPVVFLGVSLLTVVVTAILSWIVYNNVVINELNEKILAADAEIANQDNLTAQYQLKIDRALTTPIVQEFAETKLGMTKANSAQKEFVSLTDGDKGEVVSDDADESFLSRLARMFHF